MLVVPVNEARPLESHTSLTHQMFGCLFLRAPTALPNNGQILFIARPAIFDVPAFDLRYSFELRIGIRTLRTGIPPIPPVTDFAAEIARFLFITTVYNR